MKKIYVPGQHVTNKAVENVYQDVINKAIVMESV